MKMIVGPIVEQHSEDVMVAATRRAIALDAGHVDLARLARIDELILAHLDGLRVAGDAGLAATLALMAADVDGSAFAPTWLAVERKDQLRREVVLAFFGAAARVRSGMGPALRWMVYENLAEPESFYDAQPTDDQRCLALMSFGPRQRGRSGDVIDALTDPSPAVRKEAVRTASRLGHVEALDCLLAGIRDPDPSSRFLSAASSVLLGNRGTALDVLCKFLVEPGPWRRPAWSIAGPTLELERARVFLGELAAQPGSLSHLIAAIGDVGNSEYVPWLIRQMAEPAMGRSAGEAFSRISGVDLARADLDGAPPQALSTGPDDDAANEDVEIDRDDGLPWPNPSAVAEWWQLNHHRYPSGHRFFMGSTPSMPGCLHVLKYGCQRQRRAAALWRMLLQPGTPYFPVDAPVHLQRYWLERESTADVPRRRLDPARRSERSTVDPDIDSKDFN